MQELILDRMLCTREFEKGGVLNTWVGRFGTTFDKF
jgi:hypothetical protein